MSPSCHTQSNDFERSKKIPQTSLVDCNQKIYKFQAVLREVGIHENQKVWTQTDQNKVNYSLQDTQKLNWK